MNALFAKTFHSIIQGYGGEILQSMTESIFLKNLKADFRFNGDFNYADGIFSTSVSNPFRLTNIKEGFHIIVPKFQYNSDLGNIPHCISKLFESEKMENYARLQPNSFPKSYAFHDGMYSFHQVLFVNNGKMRKMSISRVQADVILFLGLAAEGARLLESQLIYRSVRMFGSPHWKIKKEQ